MRIQREVFALSKELKKPDYNLIGIIKLLNKNNFVDIEISEDEQVITGTEQDIVTLCIIAGNVSLHQYEKAFSFTFMHIDEAINMMRVSKDELMEALEGLAAAGLQDHYIDDSGNMTVIQFLSEKVIKNQNQRRRKRGKVRRPNRRKKK